MRWQTDSYRANGMENRLYRYVRVRWGFYGFHRQFCRYDGLPMRSLSFGIGTIHWGQDHEWIELPR